MLLNKKRFKEKNFNLENAKKNLNRIQEDFISLAPLISAGEQLYIILNDLIESQKEDHKKFQKTMDRSMELLQIQDSEKQDVDVIKVLEFELADLKLKGHFNFEVEKQFELFPHFYCIPGEFRLALRKLLAFTIEMMNVEFPLKIIIEKKNNSNVHLQLEFASKAETKPHAFPAFSKALFLRNKIALNIVDQNLE